MSEEKIVDFAPPGLNGSIPEPTPPAVPTRGDRLVNKVAGEDTTLHLQKHRMAQIIEELGNMPIATRLMLTPTGPQLTIDLDHKMLIETAINQVMLASMAVERAMGWRKG